MLFVWSDFQGDKATPQGDEAQEGEEATTAEASSSTSEGDGEGGYRGRRGKLRPHLFGFPKGTAPWRKDSHRVPGLHKTMLCHFWFRGEKQLPQRKVLHARPRQGGATARPGTLQIY